VSIFIRRIHAFVVSSLFLGDVIRDDLTQGSFDSDKKETKQNACELLKVIYAATPGQATNVETKK